MNKPVFIFLVISYTAVSCFSFAIFYLSRPFKIVDHAKTKIVCLKNNLTYDTGPNLFFLLQDNPGPMTDKNIRKLCEYSILEDRQDLYKAPTNLNYRLLLFFEKNGSSRDAFLLSSFVLAVGIYFINRQTKRREILPVIIISALFTAAIIFFALLRPATARIYCKRQLAAGINNFERASYGFGLTRIRQEESIMKETINTTFLECLRKEGLKM